MKTLQQIKDYVAYKHGWKDWKSCLEYGGETEEIIDEIAKLYAKEVAMEALKNASDEVAIRLDYEDYTSSDWIDKRTILNESNIPEI